MKRLIIRPGALGDFVVSIPALQCLQAGYLEIWTAGANVPLAARLASRARSITATGLDLLELGEANPRLLDTLRGFDSIVSWYGANRAEFRAAVAAFDLPFHFFPALPPEGCGSHAVDFYLAQVRSLVPCAGDGLPRIECAAKRGNFAVIHPFAGSKKKCWPLEHFRQVAATIQKHIPVKWCAGPEDNLPEAVRFDDLYDLSCWLGTARLYIGNDSGPTHLAAAVGTPVVALFGESDPAVWSPRGPHVRIAAAAAMHEISVHEVLRLIADML